MMTIDEQIEINKRREYLVVKSNELIQKTRFALSLPEQKTVAYICSMIKPIDAIDRAKHTPFQLDYEFNIRDYCKVCGIDYNNGKNYNDIKAVLLHLAERTMWLNDGNEEVTVRWLSKARINKRSGRVKISIDEDLAPYLFDLKERFAQYQLYNILSMKSAFSVRLYEILKSYAFQRSKAFDIDELKEMLMVSEIKSYHDFSLFRKNVLEKAQTEINSMTDLKIGFEAIKKGRKVIKIKFRIQEKL